VPRFAPIPCIFRLVTPVLRALTGLGHIPKETAAGPHSSRTLRFPFREPPSGPIHFPLDLIPSPRYNIATQVIYKITAFFDNLTEGAAVSHCGLYMLLSRA
jgi:hypothetical protein